MEYLQYYAYRHGLMFPYYSFKPCYKWNTFNTAESFSEDKIKEEVLNLVINGIPSIPKAKAAHIHSEKCKEVLNLVINGIPSIPLR